jgi:DNA-directed RNA polymerase specialized sigma54-like protein
MINKEIVESDAFLELAATTQLLYFYLIFNADDDGFLRNTISVAKKIGASKNNISQLVRSKFIIRYSSGTISIVHWLLHNSISRARHSTSISNEEIKKTFITQDNLYSVCGDSPNLRLDEWIDKNKVIKKSGDETNNNP